MRGREKKKKSRGITRRPQCCASLAWSRARCVAVPARYRRLSPPRALQRHRRRTMATLCYKGRGGKFFLFRDCEGAVGFRQWAFFFFFPSSISQPSLTTSFPLFYPPSVPFSTLWSFGAGFVCALRANQCCATWSTASVVDRRREEEHRLCSLRRPPSPKIDATAASLDFFPSQRSLHKLFSFQLILSHHRLRRRSSTKLQKETQQWLPRRRL